MSDTDRRTELVDGVPTEPTPNTAIVVHALDNLAMICFFNPHLGAYADEVRRIAADLRAGTLTLAVTPPPSGAADETLREALAAEPTSERAARFNDCRTCGGTGNATSPPECSEHREVQHRDGKRPWCSACGWRRGRPAVPATQIRTSP